MTVRHLLTHTGGTGNIFGPEYDRNRLQLREHADYVKLYGSRPPNFEPGSRFQYSNYGFVLLGAIIEAVSGESYYDYVREHVFGPAGMTSTESLPESVGGTEPFDRLHAFLPRLRRGSPTPTGFPGGAPPPGAATRRSATSRDSPTRSRATGCSAPTPRSC